MLAVQMTVGDYAKWRAVFDKRGHAREGAGIKNEHVYRSADNPKELLLWLDVADVAKLREAAESPDFRAAMQEAGVIGSPKFHSVG
jgi:hypothetical protein